MIRFTQNDIARFWSHVNIKAHDDCWLWKLSTDTSGYGIFRCQRKLLKAHRFAFIITVGDPGEWLICHTCDNTRCCNPKHLFEGTILDNMKDRDSKGRGVIPIGMEKYSVHLSQEQIDAIMQSSTLQTQRELAIRFNVSEGIIFRVLHGRKQSSTT